jgi:hypothetical protein
MHKRLGDKIRAFSGPREDENLTAPSTVYLDAVTIIPSIGGRNR